MAFRFFSPSPHSLGDPPKEGKGPGFFWLACFASSLRSGGLLRSRTRAEQSSLAIAYLASLRKRNRCKELRSDARGLAYGHGLAKQGVGLASRP